MLIVAELQDGRLFASFQADWLLSGKGAGRQKLADYVLPLLHLNR